MGLGRGWACIGIQLNYSKTGPGSRIGSGAACSGRVGRSRVGEGYWDSIQLL